MLWHLQSCQSRRGRGGGGGVHLHSDDRRFVGGDALGRVDRASSCDESPIDFLTDVVVVPAWPRRRGG